MKERFGMRHWLKRVFGLPAAREHTARLIASGEVARALDVGCGEWSHLSGFRPGVWTAGVDVCEAAVARAKARGLHDAYLAADVLAVEPAEIVARLGGEPFDLVTLYGVIEHLPKRQGFALLEQCEAITRRFVLLETLNGFVPQGPEFGNEHQRHLSGWFAHDFMGLGYEVFGTTGLKYLHGYAGEFRWRFSGVAVLDAALAWGLRADVRCRHAFNLLAVKDVRGVPARLSRPA
ncbi:MAG: hypothetical protein M2R45_01198 [Verrucomicrobia subdivision 3 bacterium]|nr:hypothetical protein [Limisphaerales bacterium]MCS1415250.1 hypothetical protein [Limisphaerales bacterium]